MAKILQNSTHFEALLSSNTQAQGESLGEDKKGSDRLGDYDSSG